MDNYREILEAQRSGKNIFSNIMNNSLDFSNRVQTHNHEFEGSVKLAEEGDDRHNHRFAGLTSQVIPLRNGNHIHRIRTTTDFFGHLHEIIVETEPAIRVSDDKHVHFVNGYTREADGHVHEFQFATLIEAPLLPLEEDDEDDNCCCNCHPCHRD